MRCPKEVASASILLLCNTIARPAAAAIAAGPRGEQPVAAIDQSRRLPRRAQAPPAASPSSAQKDQPSGGSGGTIIGFVYEDLNRDGMYDPSVGDSPVQGADVRLFSCSTGARVGTASTDDDGTYRFDIHPQYLPNGSTGCYYVQFTVDGYALPNAVFTTPLNGETGDINLNAGGVVTNVDAGAYGASPAPTPGWPTVSYGPSPGGGSGQEFVGGGQEAVVVGEVQTFETATASTPMPTPVPMAAPSPSPMVSLPLPTETVATPTNVQMPTAETSVENEQNEEAADESDEKGEQLNEEDENEVTNQQQDQQEQQKESTEEEPVANENENQENSGILYLKTIVRVELGGLQSEMNEDAQKTFEKVCAEFLTEQLAIATPPVSNLECAVVDQAVVQGSRRRLEVAGIRHGDGLMTEYDTRRRALRIEKTDRNVAKPEISAANKEPTVEEGGLVVDVEVTGEVEKTESIQESEDEHFDQLLVGTFNVQGYLFADALKEEEKQLGDEAEGATTTTAYFESVGGVRGAQMSSAESQEEGEASTGEDNGTIFSKGVITAIAVGGVVLILLILISIRKARRIREEKAARAYVGIDKGNKRSKGSAGGGAKDDGKKSFAASAVVKAEPAKASAATTDKVRPSSAPPGPQTSPTNTASTRAHSASPTNSRPSSNNNRPQPPPQLTISPSADSEDIEIGIKHAEISVPQAAPLAGSKQPRRSGSPRLKREIVAPPGKLGMMIANTTTGHGPAIHTIRPGSPVEGKLFINDIIVAVNGVDTREYTAEQITRVMKDTFGEERRITVLSARR